MKNRKLARGVWVLAILTIINVVVLALNRDSNSLAMGCRPSGYGCYDWPECQPDAHDFCVEQCSLMGSTCRSVQKSGPAHCDGFCYCYSLWYAYCYNGTQWQYDCYIASEGCGAIPPQKKR